MGKPNPAGPPDPAFRPPTLGPQRGWGLCPSPARSPAEPSAPARAPRPRVRPVLPPQQLRGPGSHWGRRWPGPTAPAPPSPLPPLPPGGRRRLGGPPSALQAAAAASPVPAPPSRGGSDVRSPRVPGRGERGRQCRGRQATASRELHPDGEPSAGGKGLSWGRAGGEGRSVRSNPQTPSRTSSPLPGLPPPPGARDLGCGGAAGVGGEGRAAFGMLRARTGREGGGGRGRNLEPSRGTQRGHHGECGMDGCTSQSEHGAAAPARGGRQ